MIEQTTLTLAHSVIFPPATQDTLVFITCCVCLTGLIITGMITTTK